MNFTALWKLLRDFMERVWQGPFCIKLQNFALQSEVLTKWLLVIGFLAHSLADLTLTIGFITKPLHITYDLLVTYINSAKNNSKDVIPPFHWEHVGIQAWQKIVDATSPIQVLSFVALLICAYLVFAWIYACMKTKNRKTPSCCRKLFNLTFFLLLFIVDAVTMCYYDQLSSNREGAKQETIGHLCDGLPHLNKTGYDELKKFQNAKNCCCVRRKGTITPIEKHCPEEVEDWQEQFCPDGAKLGCTALVEEELENVVNRVSVCLCIEIGVVVIILLIGLIAFGRYICAGQPSIAEKDRIDLEARNDKNETPSENSSSVVNKVSDKNTYTALPSQSDSGFATEGVTPVYSEETQSPPLHNESKQRSEGQIREDGTTTKPDEKETLLSEEETTKVKRKKPGLPRQQGYGSSNEDVFTS
uniref:Uncharacterized protein n=1 Tax=Plectus sambesii TaxID=2011161 RepID=A0A914WMV4_9BILA